MAASKLPSNQIIGEAFGFVFGNLRPLARAAAVPFAVMTLSLLRMMWAEREGGMALYAAFLWVVIQFAAMVPFQTQAYRFAAAMTPDRLPGPGWPWGRRETAFVLNALALMAASAVAAALIAGIIAALSFGQGSSEEEVARLLAAFLFFGVPAMLVVGYASARISPIFPAAAVGHAANWRAIWRATRGNGWRLVWIMLAAVLPWFLASLFLQALATQSTGFLTEFLLGTARNILGLIAMAVPAVALGLAYRHLMPGQAAPPRVSLVA